MGYGYGIQNEESKLEPKTVRNTRFSKLIVMLCILTIILFTVAVLFCSLLDAEVPDSLIVSFFSFFGVELMSLAVIKVKDKGGAEDAEGTEGQGLRTEAGVQGERVDRSDWEQLYKRSDRGDGGTEAETGATV